MPHVTVKLIYTPKPDANEVRVSVGGGDYPIRFDPQYGGWCGGSGRKTVPKSWWRGPATGVSDD